MGSSASRRLLYGGKLLFRRHASGQVSLGPGCSRAHHSRMAYEPPVFGVCLGPRSVTFLVARTGQMSDPCDS